MVTLSFVSMENTPLMRCYYTADLVALRGWWNLVAGRKSRGSRAAKLGALSPAKVSFGQLVVNSEPLILGVLLRLAPTFM
jgi:hypothetical protein